MYGILPISARMFLPRTRLVEMSNLNEQLKWVVEMSGWNERLRKMRRLNWQLKPVSWSRSGWFKGQSGEQLKGIHWTKYKKNKHTKMCVCDCLKSTFLPITNQIIRPKILLWLQKSKLCDTVRGMIGNGHNNKHRKSTYTNHPSRKIPLPLIAIHLINNSVQQLHGTESTTLAHG